MDNNKTSMEIPEDFTSPEILYDKLKKRILEYHPSSDLEMVEKAYKLAYEAHKEQKRKSGEPYIIHPLCVAGEVTPSRISPRTSNSTSKVL